MLARLASILPNKYIIHKLPNSEPGSILLTFDDGPTPGVTEDLLDLLEAYNVRAIFFTVGVRIQKAPHLVSRICQRGHQVGNHGNSHNMSRLQTPRFFFRDLEKCSSLIEENGGGKCRFFRAPGGRLTPLTLLGPNNRGLQNIFWSLDSGDWSVRGQKEARILGRKLANQVRRGDILLFHDFHPSILSIMSEFLPRAKEMDLDLHNPLIRLINGDQL